MQEAPPAEWEESARAPFLAHFFFASFDDRGVGGVLLGRLSRRVAASLKGGTRKGAVQLALPSSGTCVRVPSWRGGSAAKSTAVSDPTCCSRNRAEYFRFEQLRAGTHSPFSPQFPFHGLLLFEERRRQSRDNRQSKQVKEF